MCHKAQPIWLVLDSMWHTYLELREDELVVHRERSGFLACTACRQQVVRYNTGKRKRELKFVRWEG
jgi:hypothetical protein